MTSLDVTKSETLPNIYILYFKTIILIYPLPLAQYIGSIIYFIMCDMTESAEQPPVIPLPLHVRRLEFYDFFEIYTCILFTLPDCFDIVISENVI